MGGKKSIVVLSSRIMPVFLRRARRLGIDTTDLCRRAGLSRDAASETEVPIGLDAFRSFADELAERAKDPLFGHRAGRESAKGEYGLVEYLVRNGETVRGAAQRLAEYGGVAKAQARSFDPESGLLKELIAGEPECLGRQGNEFSMTYMMRIGREVAGSGFLPRRVHFAHVRSSTPREFGELFGTQDIVYGAGFNALELGPEVQALRIEATDPALLGVLESTAKKTKVLAEKKDDVHALERIVAEELATMDVSSAKLAKKLGVSERTLHRRLEAAGTSVRDIVESVRERTARACLEDPKRSIDDIARMLGYSDQRAFRRWTGKTPSTYRRHGK